MAENLTGEQTDEHGWVRLSGTVERIIYENDENGYLICDFGTDDSDLITAVGNMPLTSEGDSMILYGRWVHNPKYGRQFKVEQYEKSLPADKASILRYLSSHTVKGIGPVMAKKIVDQYGEDTFDVIENHPDWLAEIPGVSRRRADEIGKSFREQAGVRSAMMFFREYFGAALTVRIYKRWGTSSVDVARQNPYRLCEEVDGIGFEKADAMAVSLGLRPDSRERLMSGILYVLSNNAAQNGHVCLPESKLIPTAAALLRVTMEQVSDALSGLFKSARIQCTTTDGERYFYTNRAFENERYIAQKLLQLDVHGDAVDAENINAFIAREERRTGVQYAALQKKAIFDALGTGVMILTGGPGTGKTTVVRALLAIFESMDKKVALTAPTGRAAKRLSESTQHEAKTVHRLLEMDFGGGGDEGESDRMVSNAFRRDENNLLEENVIIMDEASMVDNNLMAALLKAIKPGAHFLIIGDADQLPSVGAGNVLQDLIDSGRFATVRLTEIFRQAQESLIVTNAHAINSGELPKLHVRDNDFFFMARDTDREIAATVAELYRNRLPRAYPAYAGGIQIISPSRRGEAGTENLNILLQGACNPPAKGKKETRFRETCYRVGDRVMQVRNNYDITWSRDADGDSSSGNGIFNGDIGVITAIDNEEKQMEILFEDKRVHYDFSLLGDLEHAWAITVHKSQGSEYPIVIVPMYDAPAMLLTRNLLYTAVTRAQNMVILVGRASVVEKMVHNNLLSLRYTGLCQRLLAEGKP